jgi:hypothetical protein
MEFFFLVWGQGLLGLVLGVLYFLGRMKKRNKFLFLLFDLSIFRFLFSILLCSDFLDLR